MPSAHIRKMISKLYFEKPRESKGWFHVYCGEEKTVETKYISHSSIMIIRTSCTFICIQFIKNFFHSPWIHNFMSIIMYINKISETNPMNLRFQWLWKFIYNLLPTQRKFKSTRIINFIILYLNFWGRVSLSSSGSSENLSINKTGL